MFVTSNEFSAIRAYFHEKLSDLYTAGELKIILKYLYLKRFPSDPNAFLFAEKHRLSESDLLYFHDALKRLKVHEPFQYVLGEAEFYGLELKSDARALIPRPETEELVDWILSEHQNEEVNTITDLCAGSGCIALALKSKLPNAKVVAWEWSREACDLIQENSTSTNLEIEIIHADALNTIYADALTEKQDLIVSNPPYIPLEDKKRMEANVLDFEPEMALFVEDDDPLIFYREILQRSVSVLAPKGWVYYEIHEDLAEEIIRLFEECNFVNIELRKDLQGKDRMVRGQVLPCNA